VLSEGSPTRERDPTATLGEEESLFADLSDQAFDVEFPPRKPDRLAGTNLSRPWRNRDCAIGKYG